MTTVETVRGPISLDRLGNTLAHEHVIIVTDWIQRDFPNVSWNGDRTGTINRVGERLRCVKAKGIDTIIDCTAMGHGRDIRAVAEANAMADINIVVATGVFTYDELPKFFEFRPPSKKADGSITDILRDFFVHEITKGIQGTDIKAAIIKCATDSPGVTANIDRILRATAWAHRETGAPITTHTNAQLRSGLEQQRIFREEGVDLERVAIGHCGDTDDLDYLFRILDEGSFIGADRFGFSVKGMPDVDGRIAVVRALIERGYENQILLSQDYSIYIDWWPPGTGPEAEMPRWRPDLIPDEIVPAMLASGISRGAIDKMLVANPRRFLTKA
jgi:phosphotriesterase-related protein